jgi:hypothetical protein
VVDDEHRFRFEGRRLGEEGVEEAHRAKGGDLREEHEDVDVRLLQQPERSWIEAAAEVDHDVIEARAQDLDDPLQVLDRHPEVGLGSRRCREHREA